MVESLPATKKVWSSDLEIVGQGHIYKICSIKAIMQTIFNQIS